MICEVFNDRQSRMANRLTVETVARAYEKSGIELLFTNGQFAGWRRPESEYEIQKYRERREVHA